MSRQGGPQSAQWTSCHGMRGYFLRSNSSLMVSSHEFGSDSLNQSYMKLAKLHINHYSESKQQNSNRTSQKILENHLYFTSLQFHRTTRQITPHLPKTKRYDKCSYFVLVVCEVRHLNANVAINLHKKYHNEEPSNL